jgi:hypothetical protein
VRRKYRLEQQSLVRLRNAENDIASLRNVVANLNKYVLTLSALVKSAQSTPSPH